MPLFAVIALLLAVVVWRSHEFSRSAPVSRGGEISIRGELASAATSNRAADVSRTDQAAKAADANSAKLMTGAAGNAAATAKLADSRNYEVCGMGTWHPDKGPRPKPAPIKSDDPPLQAALGKLLASKDELDRAVALYLKAQLAAKRVDEEHMLRNPRCWDASRGTDCSMSSTTAQYAARAQAAKPLVDLANTTNDPAVYATALYLCRRAAGGTGSANPCDTLSVERMAELDPNNGHSRLLLAHRNWRRQRTAGQMNRSDIVRQYDEAIALGRYEKHIPPIARVIDTEALQALAPDALGSTLAWLEKERDRLELVALDDVYLACGSNGKEFSFCPALAQKALETADSSTSIGLAHTFAERAGLPKDQVAAAKHASDELIRQKAMREVELRDPSCEVMAKLNAERIEALRHGDLVMVHKQSQARRDAPAMKP